MLIPRPPKYSPTITVTKRWRFKASSASTTDEITFNQLGNLWVMATGTTAAYQICNFVKIHSVEIWAPALNTVATMPSCTVEFPATTAGSYGSSKRVSDTSTSMTVPAYVKAIPNRFSQVAQWQPVAAGAIAAFNLTYTAQSTIDVCLSHRVRDETGVLTVALAGAATVGQVYYLALDGPAANLLVPDIGLPTIT